MTFTAETTARVYDNLATAVLLFDDQLRLTCVNAAGENLLYVSNRQMTGLKPDEILPDSRVFDAALKRTLRQVRHILKGAWFYSYLTKWKSPLIAV